MGSEGEFVKLMTDAGLSMGAAQDLYAMADIDGSGNVDFNEFVAVMFNPDALDPSDLAKEVAGLFHDLSRDGIAISKDDFVKGFPASMDRALILKLFDEIDANHSGHINQTE